MTIPCYLHLLKVAGTFDHSLYWIELLLGIAIWIKCLYLASVTVFPNLIGLGMVWHGYVLIKIRCKLLNIENFLTHCVKKILANLTIFHFWFQLPTCQQRPQDWLFHQVEKYLTVIGFGGTGKSFVIHYTKNGWHLVISLHSNVFGIWSIPCIIVFLSFA